MAQPRRLGFYVYWIAFALCYTLWLTVSTIPLLFDAQFVRARAVTDPSSALDLSMLGILAAFNLSVLFFMAYTALAWAHPRTWNNWRASLAIWIAGVASVFIAGVASLYFHKPTKIPFLESLAVWAENNLDVAAIQEWGSTVNLPADSDGNIPESEWPDEIAALHATSVWKEYDTIQIHFGGGFGQWGVDIPLKQDDRPHDEHITGNVEEYDGAFPWGIYQIRVSPSLKAWVD
jgi:hypothetical protein